MGMPKQRKDNNNTRNALLTCYAFISFFVLFSVIMSKNIALYTFGYLTSSNWVSVEAELTSASISERRNSSSNSSNSSAMKYSTYAPSITYTYTFEGNTCKGNKVTWVDIYDDNYMHKLASQYAYKFKNGMPIKVFANPDKPCESIAVRDIVFSHTKTSAIVMFIMLSFAAGIIFLIRKIKRRTKTK